MRQGLPASPKLHDKNKHQRQQHRRRPYVLDHIFYNDWLKPIKWKVKPTPSSDHHVLTAEFEFTK